MNTFSASRLPVAIRPHSDPDHGMWLFVLCSDGSMWRTPACSAMAEVAHWEQLPSIPQPEEEEA